MSIFTPAKNVAANTNLDNQLGPNIDGTGSLTINTNGRTSMIALYPSGNPEVTIQIDNNAPVVMPTNQIYNLAPTQKMQVRYSGNAANDMKFQWTIN